jgi:hypothetical protein
VTRKKTIRKSSQAEPLDLCKVNPRGRVDVLAAQALDKLAQSRVPQLIPLIAEKKGVIHAVINSQLGPHAIGFDLVGLMDDVSPYIPVLEELARGLIARYMAARGEQAPGGVTP